MPPPTPQALRLTYRHLYQHLLRAVQYSTPARYTARDHLRAAFRNPSTPSTSPSSYDPVRISKTLEFLENAAREKGLEHRIVKNFMHVAWERRRLSGLNVREEDVPFRQRAHVQFDRTIERLNESMGLCM